MKRPRTTGHAAPPPGHAQAPEPAPAATVPLPPPLWRETAPILAAVLSALDTIETAPRSGPAVKAYRSFLRREGEAAMALGGPEAMDAVLHQVIEADPEKARARKAILGTAWAGLLPD